MRRELIWVVAIGILFGLIVAFGVWRINSSMNKSKPSAPAATPASQNPGVEFKITLNAPENNNVVTTTPINVTGITKPLAWLIISGEKGDYILQSDEKGIFTQDVGLEAGINRIRLTAFDPTGSQSTQKVIVIYSSAFQLKTVPVSTSTGSATRDAAIRETVAEKVAAAMNQPKAYLGVVTDITSSTIQIKNTESQIEQIAIGADGIAVVNSKGTTSKQVKLTDIAIGDFIVAMGYVNGDHVLKAQRVLITDPLKEAGLSVSMGKVTGSSAKSLTVVDLVKGEETTITPSKNTVVASYSGGKTANIKIAAIKADDTVIYVTDNSTTPPSIRSIFDIW